MNGDPVWLASVSHVTKMTHQWSEHERARAKGLLLAVLEGVGDPKRQRLFRMCVTMCLHRALSREEIDALPPSFHEAEAIDIAGGPVEILEETEPGRPSTRPCENPKHIPIEQMVGQPTRMRGATFAMDCGVCGPCAARRAP